MNEVLNVLCLEDSPHDAEIMHELLTDAGYVLKIDCTAAEKEFVSFLRSHRYDIILSDFKLPGFDGFAALRWAVEICPDVPFICVSGSIGESLAVEMLKEGAVDYVLKDRLERLPSAIKRALDEANEKRARKSAEMALHESEERFRTLFENSTVGIYRTTPNGDIILANPYLINLLGYTSFGELSRRNLEQGGFEPSYERSKFIEVIEREGEIKGLESAWTRADGETVFVSESARAIRDNKGRTLYYDGIIADITSRKKAEELRLESENRYRSLFENMLNGFAYCKMIFEGGNASDFIYLEVNKAFEKLTGLKNVVGRKVSEIIPGIRESDKELFDVYARVALTGIPEIFENYVDSLKMWFSISVYSPGKEYFVAVFDVITERKLAEKALRESEDKFKYIFDHSIIGKSITMPTGEIIVNNSFCKMLGYKPGELTASNWQELTHPEDKEMSQKHIDTLLSGKKETAHFNKRYLHKNGSIVWADVGTSLRRDADGNPLYFMTYVIDITERLKIEKSLKESEEKFRKAFLTNPDSITITRLRDGMYISVNNGFSQIFGYSEEEVIGRTSLQINMWQNPEDRKHFTEGIKTKGIVENFEARLLTKSQKVKDCLVSATKIDFNGSAHILSTTRDVTELKGMDEALRESRAKLDAALASMTDAVCISNTSGEFIHINDAFATFHRFRHIAECSKMLADYPDIIEVFMANGEPAPLDMWAVPRALRGEIVTNAEYILRRKDTRETWVGSYSFSPIRDNDGEIVGSVVVGRDITDQKKAAEQLQKLNEELEMRVAKRTEQLELANKELEAFSYSVSHDLRAPLRAVDGFSKFVIEDYGDKLDAEGNRMLGLIRSNTQKMDQLITDLLNLSRVSRRDLQYSDIDMTQMALSMFNETAPDALKGNIKLILDKLPEAFADPVFIKQVWINLLSNAVKFTSKNKKPEIRISSKIGSLDTTYSISDNGAGFNQQYVNKLFGVFQRLHKSEDFEGTGVGLAIVQRIIHRHGGKVWAEGEEGKGATFYFCLPVKKSG